MKEITFDDLRQLLLYRRIVKWNDDRIELDNGVKIRIEMTDYDCCAYAAGVFKNVVLDAEYKQTMKLIWEGEKHLDTLAEGFAEAIHIAKYIAPTVDAVPVVRCRECINAEPLERNCEVNANFYMHCRLWRGEECKNVWHKYKRYCRDYSLVQHDDFCSSGERKEGDRDA